ncbi:spoIIIJ-associated protein [Clostridium tetanomorphum]|uniref:RNA-binding protein KhpB n=1 Tax=Clostridium tetanomorphum TaxID=1553 RepID=A0A923EC23_CLOTT|nr:RNA-binding cell elongation regulator Jag/EloR [Clostridium tetanomorphum]KAJ49564.1 DNA/RNA-binding protein [Clostridium tetanomorphum DSM 665]KAJ50017.1 DNA/RNA-binding protein [Clostridium tetanomorphum DSM 665]MBC2399006.1 protein jag [Clostridium tetanomorphum]MBP1866212.1 spoIIIJ-associated protein [Clostridium tetanomorphum]NRS86596.1 spoIIIJ-associated protein [Clostridium tetanomorphum]
MKTIDMTGKTVEDAVNNALKELNVAIDKVEVEVIDEGSKGLFKLIGARPAKVKVTVKKDHAYEAKNFLREVLESMGIKAEIRAEEEENVLRICMTGPNMGILIGYRGETLDSLQYLVSLVVNKNHEDEYKRVILDTENYRQKREETLKRLALKIGNKARRTGKIVKLEPMNPYERRIIHSVLQNDPYVETYSEGEEPYRRVVVDLKKA